MEANQVAKYVRVQFNSNFEINSLSDRYLICENIIFIDDSHIYNDQKGEYVFVKGGSFCNSGIAYLSELDLEFPIGERPLYSHESIDYSKIISQFKNNLL